MNEFQSGPFVFSPSGRAGSLGTKWEMSYAGKCLGMHTIDVDATQSAIIETFGDERSAFIRAAAAASPATTMQLIEQATEKVLATIRMASLPDDIVACIPDDRAPTWLMTIDKPRRGMRSTIQEFAQFAVQHQAPENHWVTGLLPGAVLVSDPDSWRAPTSWEIRHVVGEGSFTGVSGARAAALAGVSAQNFRKYTASDSAKFRQPISFSIWHLLLHKLGVQNIGRVS